MCFSSPSLGIQTFEQSPNARCQQSCLVIPSLGVCGLCCLGCRLTMGNRAAVTSVLWQVGTSALAESRRYLNMDAWIVHCTRGHEIRLVDAQESAKQSCPRQHWTYAAHQMLLVLDGSMLTAVCNTLDSTALHSVGLVYA
ncbi:hypothetical protein F442_17906 [Phytophthora nicotianae P10297]|uniref:Uncharacterized protein n=2 Tax=Phytophthora nicotianae TaxID=4792 RepID=W2YEW7_PHYNI|nr:hypothetical protein F444_18086 [Phytophthora nicotianae P1976]ETP33590.1 hypothetical protein F442_17906 [Phytophthora nicotianae P10297]